MSTEPREDKITRDLSICLNNAVKIMVATGAIGKRQDFATHCKIPYNILVNILDYRTIPDPGQLKSMINVFYNLSKDYAYRHFIETFLGIV